MRLMRVGFVVVCMSSLCAIANARAVDDAPAASPNAFVTQQTTLARPVARVKRSVQFIMPTAEGHEHVVLPPLEVAPIDGNDPWTGRPLATSRTYYAPLDTTDPWTGQPVALRAMLPVDVQDPWR